MTPVFIRNCHAAWLASMLAATLLLAAKPVLAQEIEQVIDLQPGWNSIYVRLDPNETDIATVFADLPVESVWRWLPDESGVEFITDPAEGLQNLEGWFGWYPEPKPEAFLSNLYTISPNTAYLVHLGGSQARQITITGTPVFRPPRWQPNAFTLTGLPVSPSQPPTFDGFFTRSGAHSGQPIYALDDEGRWQLVDAATETIDSDAAYWIRTEGNSNFQGNMALVLSQGDSLEYARTLDELQIVLRNRSGVDASFQIRRLGETPLPLRYELEDPETGEIAWPALRDTLVQDAPQGEEVFVDLGIRRSEFTTERMDQVLEITDEFGGRILINAGGRTLQPVVQAAQSAPGARTASRASGTKDVRATAASASMAGLWLGAIQVDAVSESQQAGTEPTPVGRRFEQRVLMHVDTSGQARLIKDVILMWEDGTTRPSDQDPEFDEVDTPGRYVLVTNKDLLPMFTGATNRNGAQVGRRFSTIAYDFADEYVEMDGAFGPGNELGVELVMTPEAPTNPFRHKFHPDHDNKDAQFLNFKQEAFQVAREMQFAFSIDDPLGSDPPGWGSSIVGGTFREALTGLHKNTIFVSGSFRLRRVSLVPVLNE
ncbi:MAG: hypothetical protein R6V61_02665 [Wenzhouxiangellaceae bacterium]